MKPVKALLHGTQCRFMQRKLRFIRRQACIIKTPFQMKHCSAKAPQYEASPFHSDMKHFAYAPYDVRKWKMRVYSFAIQRYPHYIMTCNPVLYGWIFLYLDFTQ